MSTSVVSEHVIFKSEEDGPYGGSGGDPWTDSGVAHLNGPITEIR